MTLRQRLAVWMSNVRFLFNGGEYRVFLNRLRIIDQSHPFQKDDLVLWRKSDESDPMYYCWKENVDRYGAGPFRVLEVKKVLWRQLGMVGHTQFVTVQLGQKTQEFGGCWFRPVA